MKNYFAELLEIMEKECQIYKELALIEQKKNKIIIDNDVRALEAITTKEQGFVKTIVNLESLRAQVIDGFCQFKGIDQIDNIDQIFRYINPLEGKQLKERKQKLIDVVNNLMEVNDLNSKLLEQSLEYIDYSMEVARSFSEKEAGYSEDSKDRTVKVDKSIFDAKI